MKKNHVLSKILNNRILWVVVSLLTSFAIWVYVTSEEVDEITRTFRGVQVEIVGEETLMNTRNFAVTDLENSTVSIEVRGPRRIVNSLRADDLIAEVDVSRLSLAAYTSLNYDIVFPSGTELNNLTVVAKAPETVNFMVSKQTDKVVDVVGSFVGTTAEGYVNGTPVFEPSTITVTGPEVYLQDIDRAVVSFGADMVLTSTYSVDTGFTLVNAAGNPCSTTEITTSADTVRATIQINEIKEIPLAVNIIPGAGASAANTTVNIEPRTITLAGDSAILGDINTIVLDTVDLTSFETTYTQTYRIPIENGLTNLSSSEATVTITIVGLETRTFWVEDISCINIPEGRVSEIKSEGIEVTLRGTAEQLGLIEAEMIHAVVDLSAITTTGMYMPEAVITIDNIEGVGAIGETPVAVEIRRYGT